MVNCPKCGYRNNTAIKTWPIPSRKPLEKEKVRLVGIFKCVNCGVRFRSAVEIPEKTSETASIESMVGRITGIKEELMQTLVNLRERIGTLETERANLMGEIEKLRKVAESKVNALESEVSMLREEVQSLRELLGYSTAEEK